MTTPEAKQLLIVSRDKLMQEIDGLSDRQLNFKPSPEQWSITEVLEHVTLVELGIGQMIRQMLESPSGASQRAEVMVEDEDIRLILINRSRAMQSSEAVLPTGRFPSVEVILQTFLDGREKNIATIVTPEVNLRVRYWKHRAFGTIDLFQALLVISAHSERHTAQIVQIKADAGYPWS